MPSFLISFGNERGKERAPCAAVSSAAAIQEISASVLGSLLGVAVVASCRELPIFFTSPSVVVWVENVKKSYADHGAFEQVFG